MVNFISLSSGSNGNCYYFTNGSISFLIDLGIGIRTAKKRLSEAGLSIESVNFLLVTHDHFDHIMSVGTYTQRYSRPVYTTERIHQALRRNFCTTGRIGAFARVLKEDETEQICGVSVTPFEVPHDATQTVGYHIVFDGVRITVMTDLGDVTDAAVRYASDCDRLIVESNFDVDMLLSGPYPKQLKERILQGHGHLSNDQTSHLLKCLVHKDLKGIYLCHLSANNNTPQIAYESAKKTLGSIGSQAFLYCLPRSSASELFTF